MKELIERYGISEMVVVGKHEYPLLDVPMMSDETWNRLSRENAVHNFTVQNGRAPVDVEEALVWQRALVAEVLGELGAARTERGGEMYPPSQGDARKTTQNICKVL